VRLIALSMVIFMKIAFVFFLSVCLCSCFLFKDYKKKEFSFTQNGQTRTLSLLVPKRYAKEEAKDTGGIMLYSFQYPNGAVLYAAYLTDTNYQLQTFNASIHQPLELQQGGQVYKGQDENDNFYREIRQGNLRFGYRSVPEAKEVLFDSATNYASWQRN
jgi:hypothetical protein